MAQKINHESKTIEEALGFKEGTFREELADLSHDFFCNKQHDGPGHGKSSMAIMDILKLAKSKCLGIEDNLELSEYEATLLFLAFITGSNIAKEKAAMGGGFGGHSGGPKSIADLLFGGNPTGHAFDIHDMMDKVREAKAAGRGPEVIDEILNEAFGPKKLSDQTIVMKAGSREEAELHQSAIQSMAAGKLDEAMATLQKIKELKNK